MVEQRFVCDVYLPKNGGDMMIQFDETLSNIVC